MSGCRAWPSGSGSRSAGRRAWSSGSGSLLSGRGSRSAGNASRSGYHGVIRDLPAQSDRACARICESGHAAGRASAARSALRGACRWVPWSERRKERRPRGCQMTAEGDSVTRRATSWPALRLTSCDSASTTAPGGFSRSGPRGPNDWDTAIPGFGTLHPFANPVVSFPTS